MTGNRRFSSDPGAAGAPLAQRQLSLSGSSRWQPWSKQDPASEPLTTGGDASLVEASQSPLAAGSAIPAEGAGTAQSGTLLARDPLSLALNSGSAGSSTPAAGVDLDAADERFQIMRCGCPVCQRSGDAVSPGGRIGNTTLGGSTYAPAPAASLKTLADYLRVGFWQESGTIARRYNLGSSSLGPNPNNGELRYNISGWNFDTDGNGTLDGDSTGLTSARRDLVREVFKVYEATLGIRFVETTSSDTSVDLFFTDNYSGAYAYAAGSSYGNGVDYSVINVASSWYSGLSSFDSYTVQTFFHEIGHALGLGHQGLYNGTGSYSTDAKFANDSWQASMMSYFSQTANPTTGASYAFLQTPMSVDWLALDDIYRFTGFGVANAFRGDTIYGVGTNISATVSRIWNEFSSYAGRTAYTIVDGDGYDTLDVSNFSANQVINLAPSEAGSTTPSISNIGGSVGNLTIAAGTFVEAAKGGGGSDIIYGNSVGNMVWGNGGADKFYDSLGSDVYYGGTGVDWLYFRESVDLLDLSYGNDGLMFAHRDGSGLDRAWSDIENFAFNGVAYTYDQLLASLVVAPQPVAPTATLSTPGITGSAVNEGATVSIDITTANLAQGSSLYWQLSGTGVSSSDFDGLSALTGTALTDASGKAVVNLAIRADGSTEGSEQMAFALFSDAGLTNRLADLTLTIQDTSLTPTVTNLTLWGTTASDTITGGAGNDHIAGVWETGTSAAELGKGQIDRLTGLAGSDVFVMGDSRGFFYDDRSSGNLGTSDYALIADFRLGEDKLQLRSAAYRTTVSNGNLSLYWDRNNNGKLDVSGTSRDELISILQGVTSLSSNDIVWV